jgi:cycloartenol synthase
MFFDVKYYLRSENFEWYSRVGLALYVVALTTIVILARYYFRRNNGKGKKNKNYYRTPKFFDRNVPAIRGWKFACDAQSHEITDGESAEGVRLTGESAGRQIWYFDPPGADDSTGAPGAFVFNPSRNPNAADLLFRSQQINQKEVQHKRSGGDDDAQDAARRAVRFYETLQCSDGHWAGDYGGPMFLMPGLIIMAYVTKAQSAILTEPRKVAMIHYLRNHQQTDGGWGSHIESPSTMFGTALSYVSLRLLGVSSKDPACVIGRKFMDTHGGCVYTSSWAKFWLAVLGVYDWKGINSIPPEMWLLPNWFPFHPGKLWCHCRMVYLPMCYIYGKRFVYGDADTDPVTVSLRKELYPTDTAYESINWSNARHKVADIDNYSPVSTVMKFAHDMLAVYENWWGVSDKSFFRSKCLDFAMEYIHAEDQQTNYVDIGPVNKTMNMLAVWIDAGGVADPDKAAVSSQFLKHMQRIPDYLWVAEDGMKMQGYNGSQCWDTCFAIQAIVESGLCNEFEQATKKVWSYLERTQILSTPVSQSSPAYKYESPELRGRYFRHVSKGGWPFSTAAHGWPISDCTAEGLKSVLALRKLGVIDGASDIKPISDQRLYDSVNVLLALQNDDGGWATYENTRGGPWYEVLNPSEVFGDIMIDYTYVECSSASLSALIGFQNEYPDHRSAEIKDSIQRGVAFIKSIQRKDGSWYGSWACCFTYGIWFGIEGLMAGGENPHASKEIELACKFLIGHQNENGGWGEDFSSCYDKEYAANGAEVYGDEGSAVVQTAWALLGLMAAECTNVNAVVRGIEFLLRKQSATGDWMQEGITGVFNRACGITYTAYRNVFPIWALGRFNNHYKPLFLED